MAGSAYEAELRRKLDVFEHEARPGKALHLTMVTMDGASHNEHYNTIVQREVRVRDMFA